MERLFKVFTISFLLFLSLGMLANNDAADHEGSSKDDSNSSFISKVSNLELIS